MTMPADPHAVLRTSGYMKLLAFAAIIGAPIAAAAYGFLWLVDEAQDWLYTELPRDIGFDGEPMWWPLPLLALAGLLVGLTIRVSTREGRRIARGWVHTRPRSTVTHRAAEAPTPAEATAPSRADLPVTPTR